MELTELGTLLSITKGKKPSLVTGDESPSLHPYVDIKAFETGKISKYTDGAKCVPCEDGDILIVCDGARSGLVGRAIKGYVGSTLAKLSARGVSDDFLFYFVQGKYALLNTKMKGTGTPHLNTELLKKSKLIVPPYDEQARIVSRIEELFSELDNGVETLKKTKQQLAVYRQAVLKEAFGGINGEKHSIKEICKEIKVGIVIKPTQYYVDSGGVFAFRNANVRRGYIDDCDWAMISMDGHIKNRKSEVHEGDVLISRSGANLGMAAPVPKQFDGYNAIDVVIAVPKKDRILPEYLSYYTNSPSGRSIVKRNERGAAQGHLNVTVYGRLPIVVPDLQIQKRVVKKIEERLSVCDSIEETIDATLQQAEAMRQSVLKKAFEGGL